MRTPKNASFICTKGVGQNSKSVIFSECKISAHLKCSELNSRLCMLKMHFSTIWMMNILSVLQGFTYMHKEVYNCGDSSGRDKGGGGGGYDIADGHVTIVEVTLFCDVYVCIF